MNMATNLLGAGKGYYFCRNWEEVKDCRGYVNKTALTWAVLSDGEYFYLLFKE